MQTVTFINF